jgi:hypothetical protein
LDPGVVSPRSLLVLAGHIAAHVAVHITNAWSGTQQPEQLQTSGRYHEMALATHNTNIPSYLGGTTIATLSSSSEAFLLFFPALFLFSHGDVLNEHWCHESTHIRANSTNKGFWNSHTGYQPTKCSPKKKGRAIQGRRRTRAPVTGHPNPPTPISWKAPPPHSQPPPPQTMCTWCFFSHDQKQDACPDIKNPTSATPPLNVAHHSYGSKKEPPPSPIDVLPMNRITGRVTHIINAHEPTPRPRMQRGRSCKLWPSQASSRRRLTNESGKRTGPLFPGGGVI